MSTHRGLEALANLASSASSSQTLDNIRGGNKASTPTKDSSPHDGQRSVGSGVTTSRPSTALDASLSAQQLQQLLVAMGNSGPNIAGLNFLQGLQLQQQQQQQSQLLLSQQQQQPETLLAQFALLQQMLRTTQHIQVMNALGSNNHHHMFSRSNEKDAFALTQGPQPSTVPVPVLSSTASSVCSSTSSSHPQGTTLGGSPTIASPFPSTMTSSGDVVAGMDFRRSLSPAASYLPVGGNRFMGGDDMKEYDVNSTPGSSHKKVQKRAANRLSAQLSRKRKKQFMEELTVENDDLKRKELILKSIPDLIVVFDSTGKLWFVSESVSQFLQFSANELMGTSIWERLCDDSVRLLKAAFMDSLAGRRPDSDTAPLGSGFWELRLVDRDRSTKVVTVNGVVHFSGDRPECVCSIRQLLPSSSNSGSQSQSDSEKNNIRTKSTTTMSSASDNDSTIDFHHKSLIRIKPQQSVVSSSSSSSRSSSRSRVGSSSTSVSASSSSRRKSTGSSSSRPAIAMHHHLHHYPDDVGATMRISNSEHSGGGESNSESSASCVSGSGDE